MSSNSHRPQSRSRNTVDPKKKKSDKDVNSKTESHPTTGVGTQVKNKLRGIENRIEKCTTALQLAFFPESIGKKSKKPLLSEERSSLFEDIKRLAERVAEHEELDDGVITKFQEQKGEEKKLQKILEQVKMERDVLQERVHAYLEQISSLKSKLEEQRCSIGAHERQITAEYEVQLRNLESLNEGLMNQTVQKDKQLKEAQEQLKQMFNALREQETLSSRRKNEERTFISILKNDLQVIWYEKIKMEEEFKKLKKLCGYEMDMSQSSSIEYLGSILRRSKSVSDLTLKSNEIIESDISKKCPPPTTPKSSKSSQIESKSSPLCSEKSLSMEQKVPEESQSVVEDGPKEQLKKELSEDSLIRIHESAVLPLKPATSTLSQLRN